MNPYNSPTRHLAAAADELGSTGGSTDMKGAVAETKQKASEAASKAKGAASTTVARAKEEAARVAAEKKEATASKIGSYSSAMHDTAQSLEERDPNIAWFAHQAADKLQGVAEYVRNRDFAALKHDAEDLARRHPGAFFGSMFLAGLVVGNMVKASQRNSGDASGDYSAPDYGSDWAGAPVGSMGQTGGTTAGDIARPELSETERSAAGI